MNNKIIKENFEKTKEILDTILEEEATEFSNGIYMKAKLKFVDKEEYLPIASGGIYGAELGINIGSEQNKLRPVVVLGTQKDSTIAIVFPLTSKRIQDDFYYHIDLSTIKSSVLLEQIRTISKKRIIKPYRKSGKFLYLNRNDVAKLNRSLRKMYKFISK